MTNSTPKLTAINQLLSTVNKNISIIDNNNKLIEKSNKEIIQLKNINEPTLKQKQTIYAELYKIHKLKQNNFNYIENAKIENNVFKENFKITGGSTTTNKEKEELEGKNSMNNFLTYKKFIEKEQKKYNA